jgi:hypothetical protein
MAAKLESCAIALQNMRLDLGRLRTGHQSHEHITQVAERAMSLAQDVDNALYVQDELAKIGGRDRTSSGGTRETHGRGRP